MYLYQTVDGRVWKCANDLIFVDALRAFAAHYPTKTRFEFMQKVARWSETYSNATIETHTITAFIESMIDNQLLTKERIQ